MTISSNGLKIGFPKESNVINGKTSSWYNVLSGVPKKSVLGPVLFLDQGLTYKISEFADDTKITNKVITVSKEKMLQSDLDSLGAWANK